MFSGDGIYHKTMYGFLFGALLPIPFYFAARRWSNNILRHIHIPIFLAGPLNMAPYNLTYLWGSVVFGWIFNVHIKSRYMAWWQKYAYVLTTAFQVGLALSAIVIFFAVQWKAVNVDWWGNNVSYAGVDGTGLCPLRTVPNGSHF